MILFIVINCYKCVLIFFLIFCDKKGYQFWTKADRKGRFIIENVRAGNYSLYAWGIGFIGDYKYEQNIIITPGIYYLHTYTTYNYPL